MPPRDDPTGSAFGAAFGDPWDSGLDPLADPAPEPAVPPEGQPPATEQPPAAEPAPPAAEAVPPEGQAPPTESEEPPPAEGQPDEGERLYANRYRTPEDLETGYANLRELQTRTAEARNAAVERTRQLEALIYEQVMPYLQQQEQVGPAPARPTGPAQQQVPPNLPNFEDDPQAWAQAFAEHVREQARTEALAEAEQLVARQFGDQQSQWQAQMYAQQAEQATVEAVSAFREKHPEITEHSPEEYAVVEAMRVARLMPSDPASIERGFEISQDPKLRAVIQRFPALAQDDEGMAMARSIATMGPQPPPGTAPATGGTPRVSAAQAAAAKKGAHVESGTRGPAPAGKPKDAIDEMFEEDDERSKSAFFRRS